MAQYDHHVAQFGVELQRVQAAFTADAGLLGAAERVRRSRRNQLLTQHRPTSMALARRMARLMSWVWMEVARP